MLIRFRVENYRSLRSEQELSLVAEDIADSSECLLHPNGLKEPLLPVVAIYGANASGKSSVLSALQFMESAVLRSQRSWDPDGGVPVEPFALDQESSAKPSLFEVDLSLDDLRYTYGFVADSQRVLEEWLYAYPNGHQQKWLVRDVASKSEFRFSRELKGENQAIRRLTRPNSLFLSAAAQNNHAMLSPLYDWFRRGVYFVAQRDVMRGPSIRMIEDSEGQAAIMELLRAADLGLSGVVLEHEELPVLSRKVIDVLAEDDQELLNQLKKNSTVPKIRFRHTSTDEAGTLLPLKMESRGTQVLFSLAGHVLNALQSGGLLCIDEIDSSLHPLLSLELVRLFNRREFNPKGAQLVFNTHDTNLLEGSELRRDQVWFTEKDKHGATSLYPLTDFRARKHENLKRGYLQGRYGGVPFVGKLERLAGLVLSDA